MHIIATIISTVVIGLIAIFGIPAYLSIDDLKGCKSPNADAGCLPADVIVAISGGDTAARADEAVRLYRDGWAPKIIFSGAALDKSGPSNAKVMQLRALDAGVPSSAILLDEVSDNTEENALSIAGIAIVNNFKRLILVTSPYHQRRAFTEFRQILPINTAIINHPTPYDSLWPSTWWMTSAGWSLALSEVSKTIFVQVWSSIWHASM